MVDTGIVILDTEPSGASGLTQVHAEVARGTPPSTYRAKMSSLTWFCTGGWERPDVKRLSIKNFLATKFTTPFLEHQF